ncbi:hypothetical protein B0T10DRAFT_285860 [Thelonectria olida]|uniref:Uncharacterized protein n=1 Tax=Thelonectria olida TaxID=1576542 RepID=A0A9P8W864_9HYPO|nr:hypothetical protein B0T10DRAFT_285860 [Thelonectria olida]
MRLTEIRAETAWAHSASFVLLAIVLHTSAYVAVLTDDHPAASYCSQQRLAELATIMSPAFNGFGVGLRRARELCYTVRQSKQRPVCVCSTRPPLPLVLPKYGDKGTF